MKRPWRTATWVALLILATLLVAQLVSFAVVWAVPSPAAPQMSLLDAVQVMGGRAAAPLGLRRWSQANAPAGVDNDWMSAVAAAQLQVPRARVRTVWRRTPDPAVVQVQVIKQGQLLQTGPEQRATVEQALLLPGLRWPAVELAVQQPDGRWSVVGANHSELLQWRRQVLLALRMRHACQLLKANQTVEQAAASVGYQSIAAFTRAFGKAIGVQPGAYRRQHEGR